MKQDEVEINLGMVAKPYTYARRDATGDVLKYLRKRRGISQKQLAQLLKTRFDKEIDVATISRYENGVTKQPVDFLYDVCMLFSVDPQACLRCVFCTDRSMWEVILTCDLDRAVSVFFELVSGIDVNYFEVGRQLKETLNQYIPPQCSEDSPDNVSGLN